VTALAVASAIVLVQTPAIAMLLHLRPLHVDDWLLAVASGMVTGMLAALLPPRRSMKQH
jgi:Ca2+-transporting ATPase